MKRFVYVPQFVAQEWHADWDWIATLNHNLTTITTIRQMGQRPLGFSVPLTPPAFEELIQRLRATTNQLDAIGQAKS